MTTDFVDRRKHVRVYFEPPYTPAGTLSLNSSATAIPCTIWGLSAGGARLSINGRKLFIKGDRIRLRQLEFPGEETFPDQTVELEVGWSIVQKDSDCTYIGCRFMNLAASAHKAIVDLVRKELKKKNLPG